MGLIYLDACLVIYLTEGHTAGAAWSPTRSQVPRTRAFISPLVKCECLVGPINRGDPVSENAYIELFGVFVSLAMPEPVYPQAAQLRARSALWTPDALHLSWLSTIVAKSLWTNDDRLAQSSHGLARNVLK